jgi:DNA-binding transcriptional ArsR family regulator
MPNTKVIEQLKVLDNEVKLQILSLLTDSGAKSITDIAKYLKLNFSTAHKYLEQLEHAGFVKSKQETENRLKRMFYIQDFHITLNPRTISKILKGDEVERGEEEFGNFNVITNDGNLRRFDKFKFAKLYIDAGIPKGTMENVFDSIHDKLTEGITLLELRSQFNKELVVRANVVNAAVNKIKDLRNDDNTIRSKLIRSNPDSIKEHINGNIFIQNLSRAKLLNFVHDIRSLMIHGTTGKKPKNLDELFDCIIDIINKDELRGALHAFDSFNYFIAPLANDLTDQQLTKKLQEFLLRLKKLKLVRVYIGLECGFPEHLKDVSPTYFKSKSAYSDYSDVADRIFKKTLGLIKDNDDGIELVIKINTRCSSKVDIPNKSYITNMLLNKNKMNASFVGNMSCFDSSWRGWRATLNVGEIQNISINLPALAAQSENQAAFAKKLEETIDQTINRHISIAEQIYAFSIRNLSTSLPSAESGTWNYLKITDFLYNISLYGLEQLSNFKYSNEFIKGQINTIYTKLNQVSKKYNIRFALRQEQYPLIVDHFARINKQYKIPTDLRDVKLLSELQNFLDGGYVYRTKAITPDMLNKHKLIRIEK